MGSFVINGNADKRGANNVDPRLIDIMRAASASSPYDVELFSGKRNSGEGSMHDHGRAIDLVLLDPQTGEKIPNLGAGGKAFKAYENFAKTAREVQQNAYPELNNDFRWGGYFGPSKLNPTAADLMHFDTKKGGAMSQGSWDGGLNESGKKRISNLREGQTYSSTGRVKGTLPELLRTGSVSPTPPIRPQGLIPDGRGRSDKRVLMPIKLSPQDIDYIERVAATEVDHNLARTNPAEYERQMQGVVDTIMNRVGSSQYPDTVEGVVNQRRQFSKITGPKNLSPYGSVQNTPKASNMFSDMVGGYVNERVMGERGSSVGGGLNYANPKLSTPSNMAWINALKGPTFGSGQSIHKHGTTKGYRPTEAAFAAPVAPKPPMRPDRDYAANAIEETFPTQEPDSSPAFAFNGDNFAAGVKKGLPFSSKVKLRNSPKAFGAVADQFGKLGQGVASAGNYYGNALVSGAMNAIPNFWNKSDIFGPTAIQPPPAVPQVQPAQQQTQQVRSTRQAPTRVDKIQEFNRFKQKINKENPFTGDKYKDRAAQSIRSARSVEKAIALGLYKRPKRR